MDLLSITYIENDDTSVSPVSSDNDVLVLQLSGKSSLGLAPISQVNFLEPYRKSRFKNNTIFNPILTGKDIIDSNDKLLVSIEGKLTQGEILYIPAYFLKQFRYENSKQLVYVFKSNSKILDSFFKVLFDDDNSEL
jgi:hypothetical protein